MTNSNSVKNTYNYIGCDYYGTATQHLVIASGECVTADSYGNTYCDGNQVIVIARDSDNNTVYGFLAVATGEVVGTAGQYWRSYHKPQSPANSIVPVTKIHAIPAELLGTLNQTGICTANRAAVATYLLRKN